MEEATGDNRMGFMEEEAITASTFIKWVEVATMEMAQGDLGGCLSRSITSKCSWR